MQLRVINLARSTGRRAHMEAELMKAGVAFDFFDAVDARTARFAEVSRYDETRALRRFGRALAPAEVGCFASHYLLWQQCADSQEAMLLLEDDLWIEPRFSDAVRLIDGLIDRLHFVRFCIDSGRPYRRVCPLAGGFELIRYEKGPRGSQAYALSPQGARRLLARASVWTQAVDMHLDAFWEHGLPCWAIDPCPTRHMNELSAPSTIGRTPHAMRRSVKDRIRREITNARQDVRRVLFNVAQRSRDRDLCRTLQRA